MVIGVAVQTLEFPLPENPEKSKIFQLAGKAHLVAGADASRCIVFQPRKASFGDYPIPAKVAARCTRRMAII